MIDWKRLKFIARADTWFEVAEEVTLKADHTDWNDDMLVEDGIGDFWAMNGVDEGEMRLFDEFDIILLGEDCVVNGWTYKELKKEMKKINKVKLKEIFKVRQWTGSDEREMRLYEGKSLHQCLNPSLRPMEGIVGSSPAFTECIELLNGELWVTNERYDSQVNFCPVCGMEARVRIKS